MPPVGDIIEIVAFGLLFVMTAALANGLSVTPAMVVGPLRQNVQLSVFALIGNFIVIPAMVIGFFLAVDMNPQVKMAFALLALVAGAPFVAWMTSLGKGNIGYGASLSFMLMIVTIVLMPLALPHVLSWLDTGAKPSTWTLYWPLLAFLLLPLVIGMLVRARHPAFAMQAATWLAPLSIVFLLIHIMLMFVAYWSDFTAEFHTGAIAFTIGFAIVPIVVGYILAPPYILSPMKAPNQHYGTKLASAIGTAQKGSQPLICSLIFALGMYLPLELNTPALVGGVISYFVGRRAEGLGGNRGSSIRERGVIIASGLMAGGALGGVFGAGCRLIPGFSEDWVRTPFYGNEMASQLVSTILFGCLCAYLWWGANRREKQSD